jgi:hypothetical protein
MSVKRLIAQLIFVYPLHSSLVVLTTPGGITKNFCTISSP